ncbi:AAA family ATPase [Thermogemmatispora sp.]|uniref:AAA family ATPase n=1 Tax=Thermogemmatispora sp. TaxID=1968838 RepID=UPI001D60ACCF|nr:AAA family ATPase [Thermogemmatispora sp.]MBX5451200.1 AAA family ATPase [Thermogemmatispora sp.]
MIILKHLTVERFRLLRDLDLHFPQRGSILIQGPNEAGKSTLFECIYFALFGEPLTTNREKRALDDLIMYGESEATVKLTLSVGATELTITRTVERGSGQRVSLLVRRLGMPESEPITQLRAANERIITELGRLDGETLRNSCLVEQKGLQRLEQISGRERESTLRRLLGLEKLTRLAEQFRLTPEDEEQLRECSARLRLAELQARIPELSAKLGQVEEALDAVAVNEHLAEIEQQEAEIAEQERNLAAIQQKRSELKSRQARVQQLKKAEAILAELITAYDEMAEARRELPELDRQIADLELREREELPALEKRVRELEDLSRSFGTLERMATDLLATVSTIKELEQEVQERTTFEENLEQLEAQISRAQARLDQARLTRSELEERRRAGRPSLEERLRRLRHLASRLEALRQAEERYAQRLAAREQAEQLENQIEERRRRLREAEQEQARSEQELRQVEQRVATYEERWRRQNLARQLEEWLRLRDKLRGVTEAERQVRAAYQQHERCHQEAAAALSVARRLFAVLVVTVAAFAITASLSFWWALSQLLVPAVIGIVLAAACVAAFIALFIRYSRARVSVQQALQREQDALNHVRAMVAAREAAARANGGQEALARVEEEIRALGAEVPASPDEARRLIEQAQAERSSLNEQQALAEAREQLTTWRAQVAKATETVAALRKQVSDLEEEARSKGWDDIHSKLRSDLVAVEQARHELATLMGQEGLPIPTFEANVFNSPAKHAELKAIIDEALKTAELEIAALDGKIDAIAELQEQIKACEQELESLQARKQVLLGRLERFQTSDPLQQLARAREQQAALREALQQLTDSLRQRVKPLGLQFGQAQVSSAESAARRELEALHITLGRRIELQGRREHYAALLKERQQSLSGYYQQLAKFSAVLGSWIIPPNPFTETLNGLRARCQQELQAASEESILQELEQLQVQEGASRAKIELCRQEIEEIQERVRALLDLRGRPIPQGYRREEIVAVWPLVGEYGVDDRQRLEEERARLELEMQQHEREELELSQQLKTGGEQLDLEQARRRMEQQERTYQTKKRGSMLIAAVIERLMRKMIPRTEYYMQQILPLLTSGRYHDVQLVTEPEEGSASGGPLRWRVWDSAAGEYIPREALSSGAADQISFALRLAFAIAALPRELSAAPGFLLLDEPLSSFDQRRAQAVVEVVTGEMLGQHFEQIFFISHSSAFDPAQFPYYLLIDGGQVVESNLPVVTPHSALNGNGNGGRPSSEEGPETSSEATSVVA